MARKTTTKKGKSPKKRTTRKAAQGKKRGASRGTRTTRKKSTSARRRKTSAAKKSQPRATQAIRAALPKRSLPRLSSERKRDLWGVGLLVAGLLTLASLIWPAGSALHPWASFWQRALGWGLWLFPLWLLFFGAGILFRRSERLLLLNLERTIGLLVVYTGVLVGLHLPWSAAGQEAMWQAASQGRGGGYVGAALLWGLLKAVGLGGAMVLWAAWLLLGVALTLNRPVANFFGWVPLSGRWLQRQWETRRAAWQAKRAKPIRGVEAEPVSREASAASPNTPGAAGAASPVQAAPKAWVLPSVAEMLDESPSEAWEAEEVESRARLIEETLALFGAPAKVVEVQQGPTVTLYGVEPGYVETRKGPMRVRVSKIAALADDLALALAAKRVRIQAPVPGKGYVGIEVPNERTAPVTLRQVIESDAFRRLKSPLRFALGKDVAGNPVAADLAAMPHLLIAGATGSGKSVCVNGIITCLLLHNTPADLRLLLVDPKRVELSGYNGIPHLLAPVVVDLERVVGALQWVTREMERRYKLFASAGTRHIVDYNRKALKEGKEKLPYLVVVIDELADLMMMAPETTERTITRLAQLARATGIHLIIATQRPSVDVVTGIIKANFPARIAFAVASSVDSRVILDQPGAERLLGRGDMLFMAPDAPDPMRLQGVYVSDAEIRRVVQYWREFGQAAVPGIGGVVDAPPEHIPLKQKPLWELEDAEPQKPTDPLWDEAVALVRREGKASASLLQRRLRIGYTRAARLVDLMEDRGIVGPPQGGTGVRPVLPEAQQHAQAPSSDSETPS